MNNDLHKQQHTALDFIEKYFFKGVNTFREMRGNTIPELVDHMETTVFKKEFLKVAGPAFVKVVLTADQSGYGLPGKLFFVATEKYCVYYYILNNGKDMVYGNDSGSVKLTDYQHHDEYYALTDGLEVMKTAMISEILLDMADVVPPQLKLAFEVLGS